VHPEDMLEMKNDFKEFFNGDVFQLDKYVVCARTVTHGDLGIDHILYYTKEMRIEIRLKFEAFHDCGA